MKSLFYGAAVASVAGLLMGMGMELSPQPPVQQPDDQQSAALSSVPQAQSVSYGSAADAYPPAYVIDAGYAGEPVIPLRDEADPAYQEAAYDTPVDDAATYDATAYDAPSYDAPAIEQVLKTAWRDTAKAPRVTPQDVAAAGDTSTPAAPPQGQTGVRTYASIDALLNQQQIARARAHVPG